ncbi:MAG TPA: hypothetical protein VNM66_09715 [Thermodesulfobacteriota bacterium]|nr:hypothetical protein [Thermodesulfobacteriota bacterium]
MRGAADRAASLDLPRLARRLRAVSDWTRQPDIVEWLRPALRAAGGIRIGYFGTGTAAALVAATGDAGVGAIVSRDGRPDLAAAVLPLVTTPTLLIAGGEDASAIPANRSACERLGGVRKLHVLGEAGPGAVGEVVRLATRWFERYLVRGGR